jgi:hypothetical protein
MRAATYTIPPVAGDTASVECVVYFFGAGQGGSIEANLDRWHGQMLAPGGKPADAKIAKRMIHGLTVTTIDGTGTLSGGTATFSISTLGVGSHAITAVYGGDLNFEGSTSNKVKQVVKN